MHEVAHERKHPHTQDTSDTQTNRSNEADKSNQTGTRARAAARTHLVKDAEAKGIGEPGAAETGAQHLETGQERHAAGRAERARARRGGRAGGRRGWAQEPGRAVGGVDEHGP